MKKARFNVGDKVRILDGSKIKDYTFDWVSNMSKYVDRTATIDEIIENKSGKIAYWLEGFPYKWDERGLAPAENQTIVIYRNGNDVIAKDKSTGKSAKARCSKEDTFDFNVGAKLAFERLMGQGRKFKVGDKVIGNAKANNEYCLITEGWKGTVIESLSDGKITVRDKKGATYRVKEDCFDLDTSPTYYNGKVVCIKNRPYDFTVGKIYEFKDGQVVDNGGMKRPAYGPLESLEDHFMYRDSFIEVVE